MAEALLRRRSGLVLAPADGLAEIELEDFPMGRDILCTLKRSRSNPNLRHYWACLQAFSKATDKASARVLHELLKMECGLVTPVSTQSGELKLVPDSIAFDRLDEAAFIDTFAGSLRASCSRALWARACLRHLDGQPGHHPGHPTAEEGCRPASRGLTLELMTWVEITTRPCLPASAVSHAEKK